MHPANIFEIYGIINSRIDLKKTISEEENVKKILESLPREWTSKGTNIHETKDLTKITMVELIASLISHEMTTLANEQLIESIKKKKSCSSQIHTRINMIKMM